MDRAATPRVEGHVVSRHGCAALGAYLTILHRAPRWVIVSQPEQSLEEAHGPPSLKCEREV